MRSSKIPRPEGIQERLQTFLGTSMSPLRKFARFGSYGRRDPSSAHVDLCMHKASPGGDVSAHRENLRNPHDLAEILQCLRAEAIDGQSLHRSRRNIHEPHLEWETAAHI